MVKTTAIIVAAGSSSRMGFDKIFAEICGVPALLYSLNAFQAAKSIDEIIVVTGAENASRIRAYDIPKLIGIVNGGSERLQSVRNGIDAISREDGIVAIHDGARPLITERLIDKVVSVAKVFKAAVPLIPAFSTVKRVDGEYIEDTPDRGSLYLAQTPQVFDLRLYREAIRNAGEGNFTDDSSLVEQMGVKVKTVDGDFSNIKVTTPEDLLTAEALLSVQKGQG